MSDEVYSNVPLALPAEWDFGLLRDPEGPALAHEAQVVDDVAAEASELVDAEVSLDRLFWFRWITGHQIALLCWRQASLLLMAEGADGVDVEDRLERAATWLRRATTMYVYAASCPREVYHRMIRPTMTLWHAAFSGTWSVDFQPLPRLVAELESSSRQGGDSVLRAFHDGRLVHAAAACKLVPTGGSMLTAFRRSHPTGGPAPETAAFYFDSFFLIRRTRVTRADLTAALSERANRVLADVDHNGLYPPTADSRDEIPAGRAAVAFEGYAAQLPVMLAAVADRTPARGAA